MVDVKVELLSICNAVIELVGEEHIDGVFGGVMSLHDFACFVYFEHCAGYFLNQEKHQSVSQHRINFAAEAPADYEDSRIAHLSNEEKDYLFTFDTEDRLNRHLSRTLKEMLKNRDVPYYDDPEYSPVIALSKLNEFSNTGGGRLHSTPIGRGYFYQALTETVVENEKGQTYEWMSLSRSKRNRYVEYYTTLFRFIRSFMIEEYSASGSDDDVDRYIAKAINLCKLEDRYKLGLILRFASTLELRGIKYFSKNTFPVVPYRFNILPPIFFCSIAPWDSNVKCPNKTLVDIFRHFGSLIGHVYRSFICPSPVLHYDRYMDYFLTAKEKDRNIEEYRYYTIIILAEFIKGLILSDKIQIQYSNQKFAWFIHNHYNIYEIYERQASEDLDMILTPSVVRSIRQIVNNIKPV